jgi:hypothetical protein
VRLARDGLELQCRDDDGGVVLARGETTLHLDLDELRWLMVAVPASIDVLCCGNPNPKEAS